MKTLGQFIREKREELDLSLRELARRVGVSAAFMSDIELGRRYPSDDIFEKLSKPLEVTVDELKRYDSRPPVEELKRITDSDPTFGFALRKLVDKEVTAEDILKLADNKPDRKK
jgi:transcriptional regulator with XRE-family HTH domain